MANTIAYATLFQQALDKAAVAKLTSGWMDANAGQVIYNGGKEVKIPKMNMDGLGDYSFQTEDFNVEVDIKSKMFFLNSNPKGYNIDKLLRFLAEENSIYLVFVVGIDEYDRIWCQLCSIFHPQLLQATQVRHHWAGRGSRGVTQYMGEAFHQMKIKFNDNIDRLQSERFIIELLKLGE